MAHQSRFRKIFLGSFSPCGLVEEFASCMMHTILPLGVWLCSRRTLLNARVALPAVGDGVDSSLIVWRDFDGIGRQARNALNFTERGFGLRGAMGVSDRGHSATSLLQPAEIDWDHLFGSLGVRWLHTGGIFAGLSESTTQTALAAMVAARKHGTIIAVDLNYRPSLWRGQAAQKRARTVFTELAEHADVLVGGATDFTDRLGVSRIGDVALKDLTGRVLERFPNLWLVASTVRKVHSAVVNDWSALATARNEATVVSTQYKRLEILDRVGGGDGFVSGLIFGILEGHEVDRAVEYGTAHGALAMTTPGDNSMAALPEVEALVNGQGAQVQR